MKKVFLPLLTLTLTFLIVACDKKDNSTDHDIDSHGIDEYIHLVIDGTEYKYENEDYITAIVQTIAGNNTINISCNIPDSSQFVILIPNAGTSSFTFDFVNNNTTMQYTNSQVLYSDESGTGTINVTQHQVNPTSKLDVYTGNATFILKNIITSETVPGSVSFKATRLL